MPHTALVQCIKVRDMGSTTDVSVFSFHAVKNLTTAEGGAVCMDLPAEFDCDAIYSTLNMKSLHGQSKDALAKITSWCMALRCYGTRLQMQHDGYSSGNRFWWSWSATKKTCNAEKKFLISIQTLFKNKSWAIIPAYKDDQKESSYHLYCLRIKGATEAQRDTIMQGIFDRGVSVNVHFQPLANIDSL
jgi:dTDP-4-amino-4,6-dideoxygalactose transaminase